MVCVGCCAGCESCVCGWLCCVLAGRGAAGEELPEPVAAGAPELAGVVVLVVPVVVPVA